MHTIIKIAVVSVLSLFAILGLVSISKAGEMDGKNFWCIDKTSEFGEGRAYWAKFYKGKGAITIPKAGYDSGKSKLCRNLKVKTDIGWIERIYLDTFDLYWMAEIDNSEWPTSKIMHFKLDRTTLELLVVSGSIIDFNRPDFDNPYPKCFENLLKKSPLYGSVPDEKLLKIIKSKNNKCEPKPLTCELVT